jgi:hypothetical protein
VSVGVARPDVGLGGDGKTRARLSRLPAGRIRPGHIIDDRNEVASAASTLFHLHCTQINRRESIKLKSHNL